MAREVFNGESEMHRNGQKESTLPTHLEGGVLPSMDGNVFFSWPCPSSHIFAHDTVIAILHTLDEILESICWNEAMLSDNVLLLQIAIQTLQ